MLLKRGLLNTKKSYYFTNTQGLGGNGGGIQDDHLPYLAKSELYINVYFMLFSCQLNLILIKDVPILHLVPVPFPDQWHKAEDNYENLDHSRIEDIRMILKIFLMHVLNVSN